MAGFDSTPDKASVHGPGRELSVWMIAASDQADNTNQHGQDCDKAADTGQEALDGGRTAAAHK
jgi:hypothetical protein